MEALRSLDTIMVVHIEFGNNDKSFISIRRFCTKLCCILYEYYCSLHILNILFKLTQDNE